MNAAETADAIPSAATKKAETRRHIRGSTLLLAGRGLSKGIGFAAQILIVRYLSVADYGAFAYGLALVHLGQSVATLGLDRATTRFLPMFHERGEYDRFNGTLLMITATIVLVGTAIAFLFGFVARPWIEDPQAHALLLILIFLVPVQALDNLLVGLFAVFANPRAIFFRRHVLAPGLKLAVVLLLVFGQGSVFVLAWGYLVSSLLGVALCVVMLSRLPSTKELLAHFSPRAIVIPWRQVLAFTMPLLVSDLVYVVMNSVTVLFVERWHGLGAVAALRAQQPIAAMNQVVMVSFATLFTPLAARLFARQDREGVNELYWQSAVWIAVSSFPLFVLTFSLAGPLTTVLLGARYEESASILALLAVGYYFNAALGFNGLTLKIQGHVGYVIAIGVITILVNLGASLALIPRYGAWGAALATLFALICHNVLKQAGLRLGTGITLFERRYARVYVAIAAAALATLGIQGAAEPPVYVGVALAALASWVVLRCSRAVMDIERTFPEVLRLPLMKRLLGA